MSRLAYVSLALLSLAASNAAAGPITVGAGLGVTQDEASSNQDPFSTLSLFGRIALGRSFSTELDITKVNTAQNNSARILTGLVVLDLGSSLHWVPQLFAGLGIDRASTGYGDASGHHCEGGAGLEYRADGGFTIGARFHLGGRSIDSEPKVYPLACCVDLYSPNTLQASEYRSFDLYAGVRF
jgi:hypothetical protein